MKKVLFSILTIASSFGVSIAQNIDVEAILMLGVEEDASEGQKMCLSRFLTPRPANHGADSTYGVWGVSVEKGPDELIVGDKLPMRSSFHHFLTQEECDAQNPPVPLADRYAWYYNIDVTQTTIDNQGQFFSFDSIGSIGMLIDWDRWQQYGRDSARYIGPPHESFEAGKAYGFFVRAWGVGTDASNITNNDADPDNNLTVVKIIFNDCTLGLGDLVAKIPSVAIVAYPNPTTDNISVKYNFEQNANVNIYVRDLSGKTVKTFNAGHVTVGERNFNVDVATLPAGVYSVEMNAGDFRGTAKFTKK
jgi:hypothetical protein